MLVSIIVPVYNVEKYLEQCLDSICKQSYQNIEIIIVNDGSTDRSPQICENYAIKDNRVKYISKKNEGVVMACKEGLINANGKFIAFVDSDDFISVDYIEIMLNQLDDDIDMICMGCMRYSDSGQSISLSINALPKGIYELDDRFYENFIVSKFRDKYIANCRWAKLIKTDIAKKSAENCSNEITFGEDQQFTLGALMLCKKIKVLDVKKYFYRFNQNSIVNTYKNDLWQKSKLLIKTIQSIPNIEKIKNIEDQLKLQLLSYLFECLKNEQFYGGGLKKEFFLQLTEEAQSYDLFSVSENILSGMDKLLFPIVKKRRFFWTKIALYFYKIVKHL